MKVRFAALLIAMLLLSGVITTPLAMGYGSFDAPEREVEQRTPSPTIPDELENNWSPETATPVAVGVIYDLNLVCPVSWGCAGGDHDYLRLPVKAGLDYLIMTFDLEPGVDTTLDLFWGEQPWPVASSDDARPGMSFFSALRWVAPGDGEVIVRIAPRTGHAATAYSGAYRFAAVLAESELATQLEAHLRNPSDERGTVTATATSLPTPSSDAPTGHAWVSAAQTMLHEGPDLATAALQPLTAESRVLLLGQSSGQWVRVQPIGGLLPGWVRGADLTREVEQTTPTILLVPTPPQLEPTNVPPAQLLVERLEPLPADDRSAPTQRRSLTLSFQLQEESRQDRPLTTDRLSGVRIQLVNAFGDLLVEALTSASGAVTLTAELLPDTALFVQLPAAGLRIAIDTTQPMLQIVLPALVEEVDQ
jgi:hypothetical protein